MAQYFTLIHIYLKLPLYANASFSLLLILLGYKWEALTCRMWLSWRVSITGCNLLSDIRVTLWLDYPLIIRDSFYPESPLCRDYPRCHDLTSVTISQSEASTGGPLTNQRVGICWRHFSQVESRHGERTWARQGSLPHSNVLRWA